MKPMVAERIVYNWNEQYPPGTPVIVILDDGTETLTRTRSEAWVIEPAMPVVAVEGKAGGYDLGRVIPDLRHLRRLQNLPNHSLASSNR